MEKGQARNAHSFRIVMNTVSAQYATEGGNVSLLEIKKSQTSEKWAGFFGEVFLTGASSEDIRAYPNNVTELNLSADDNEGIVSMHIVISNSSVIVGNLEPGNLSILDKITGNSSENASNTFRNTGTFVLSSGTYNNVPMLYTYVNNASSTYFRQGYLNDDEGNLVFVADVVSNMRNWEGGFSDYQVLIPANLSGLNYTAWVDTIFSPPSPPGGGGERVDRIEIDEIGYYEVEKDDAFLLKIKIRNTGNKIQRDIEVFSDAPSGITISSGVNDFISPDRSSEMTLFVEPGRKGFFSIPIHAESRRAEDSEVLSLNVTVWPEEKKDNNESCQTDSECKSGICMGGLCSECKGDESCKDSETCFEGECQPIDCVCGIIANHACIPFECCSDGDCNQYETCIDNECVEEELQIMIEGSEPYLEDTMLDIIISDQFGRLLPDALVFTNYERDFTDSNGRAVLPAPFDGQIFVRVDGISQKGTIIDVTRKGSITFDSDAIAGEDVRICATDSRGNPISGVKIAISSTTKTTDENGCIIMNFPDEGEYHADANKNGYLFPGTDIDVSGRLCEFPVVLGFFIIQNEGVVLLWAFSILLAFINTMVFRRIAIHRTVFAVTYSILPLILAIPGIGILSICFMSNIVILQALAGILGLAISLAREAKDN